MSLIFIGLNSRQVKDWHAEFRVTVTQPKMKLNVPLEKQYPELPNGCEVTSLSMLLDYYRMSPGKMTLAQKIAHVSSFTDNGQYRGNPHQGFVGYMSQANAGWCVYHEPLFAVARNYTNRIQDASGTDFIRLLYLVSKGHPVMIITNTTFAPVNNLQTWNTAQGPVKVTPSSHACVLTGYNHQTGTVYVNDPFGKKNKPLSWQKLEASYNQRGKQALYIK